jgi:hypothetical protein
MREKEQMRGGTSYPKKKKFLLSSIFVGVVRTAIPKVVELSIPLPHTTSYIIYWVC